MTLLILLCLVGACFGARALFRFIGILVFVPIALFGALVCLLALAP